MSKTAQTSSTETINNKDDGSINFRPSPNFKHMRKYLKSREDMKLSMRSERKLEAKNKVNLIQPPLPPNSPPPDSPLGFVLKQEVEDEEYEQHTEEAAEDPPQIQSTPQEPERKKFIMCKDFVRKTCTRGSSCIYTHEIDKEQLERVYKFCKDYANGCCKRPVCYFVHATTFEKEDFLRTAELPPHCLAHLNTPVSQPATYGKSQKEMPNIFTKPPPLPQLPSVTAAPLGPSRVATKRVWRDIYDFASQPQDLDVKQPLAKKCKRCELTKLRLQHSKAQVAQAMMSMSEMDDKLEHIIKKNNRLHGVLKVLLKPRMKSQLLTKILLGGEGSPERAAPGS